jgi:hypothetical protein
MQFLPLKHLLTHCRNQPDMDKLAKLTGIKRKSASSLWLPVKRKVEAFVASKASADDDDATEQPSPGPSPTKPRATKRRKTVSKRVIESDTDDEQPQAEKDDNPTSIAIKKEKTTKEESDE